MTAPTKRGPGRPPLSDCEETRVLYARMPRSEHAAVSGAAERAGVSIAEYVRRAALAQARRDARRAR